MAPQVLYIDSNRHANMMIGLFNIIIVYDEQASQSRWLGLQFRVCLTFLLATQIFYTEREREESLTSHYLGSYFGDFFSRPPNYYLKKTTNLDIFPLCGTSKQ